MNKDTRLLKFNTLMGEYVTDKFYDWLLKNNFFTAPASTKYHGAYEGGLFDHSFEVAIALVNMTEKLNLKWENTRSPYIIGIFHDLCKIDKYKKVIDVSLVKGELMQFEYNDSDTIFGHGDKSVILLSRHILLTEEEILCIRYHMGAYETEEWDFYDRAIKKYPNVLWTHTADMYASKVIRV